MEGRLSIFNENPWPLPNITFAAPFYGDVDTRTEGRTWFTNPVIRDEELLNRAREEISTAWPQFKKFTPAYLIIATWEGVGYFRRQSDKVWVESSCVNQLLN